uniref:Adhesion G protein-coupled receptor F3b n=1 Tax=Oryzias latipes TaxID=8090 RepID=A0A3P9LY85_ORYLA
MLSAGQPFCKPEVSDEVAWPKTPPGVTLVNNTCPVGRVGQKQRTCGNSSVWLDVLSNCVSEELKKVSTAADNFLQGVGATQKVAMDIFEGMRNNSEPANDSSNIADIMASVNIIDTMAQATQYVQLDEHVFPNFVTSASNMLNSNWTGVNDTILHQMSSKYINSMEVLVKEIQINESSGYNTTNLELQFCSRDDCNLTVFDIGVNLNKTDGLMKVMAIKNLMDKLENNYEKREPTDLILSATLVNNSNSNITISLLFPAQQDNNSDPLCVFWNTKLNKWSDEGCIANKTGNYTLCECTHLTSFSVLMSKSDTSEPALDIITSIGVAVSICCLVLFLIVEWMVWSAVIKTHLSHFRHTAVVNISVFLLLGDCSFLASSNPANLSETTCLTLTLCKHLFFLGMFAWMLCLSILLVHQLIFVFSPLRKRVFMYLSSILGYLCPMVLVGCSYVYYNYTGTKYHNEKTCWLIYEGLLKGSIYSFILPVGTIVLANIFSMVVVIVTLVKTSVPDSSKADDKETAKGILKVVVFLTPVFGATWGFGFALLMLEPNTILFTISNYLFTIFNAFQGLFIFLVGCFGEQKVSL